MAIYYSMMFMELKITSIVAEKTEDFMNSLDVGRRPLTLSIVTVLLMI